MSNNARRQAAARGLDWRFDWMRYVIRRHGGKATVIAAASALAARAHNRDGTVFLSAETLAAEIGKQLNHTKDARALLAAEGFLTDTGRTRDGCRVWWLTCPPVDTAECRARAAEERLHTRLTRDPDLGSLDPDLGTDGGAPDLGTGGPEVRNRGTRISDAGDPDLGSHTGESYRQAGTRKEVPASDGERARERDASVPAGRPDSGAAPLGPRPNDETTTEETEATTVDDDRCFDCGEPGPPPCDRCDSYSQEHYGRPDGTPGGGGAGSDAGHDTVLPAPAAALLAALAERSPMRYRDVIATVRAAGGRYPYEGTGPIIARNLAHRVTDSYGVEWVAYGPEPVTPSAPPEAVTDARSAPAGTPDLPPGAAALLAALRVDSPMPLARARAVLEREGGTVASVLEQLERAGLAHTRFEPPNGNQVHLGRSAPVVQPVPVGYLVDPDDEQHEDAA